MRIAFYSPRTSHTTAGESGDKVFVRSLVARLRERGHEVQFVSTLNVRDLWCRQVGARRLVSEAITVRRQMRRFSPDAWLLYQPSIKNPDLFGWWQRPKRYVALSTDGGQPQEVPLPWRWLFAFAHRRSLARLDVACVWRPKCVKHLRSYGLPEDRICVVLHGIELWQSVPSQEEARQRLNIPLAAPIILCVSRLAAPRSDGRPSKTEWLLGMLEALATVRLPADATVLLVGDGPGRERIEKQISELELNGVVRLVGAVPHETVSWYYAACDFSLYPGFSDRTVLTLMEAQSCGRPVVTMRTDSAQLIVKDGVTGLLAKDLDEFRAHIATLACDGARCAEMGLAAREYITKQHSIETRVRQIEEMLSGSRE